MIKEGKLFGIINIIDFLAILLVILVAAGIFLVKSGKFLTSSNVIEKFSPIEFDVVTKDYDVKSEKELFEKGGKSFITIRNVPYTELEVVNFVKEPVKINLANALDPQNPVIVQDKTNPYRYSYTVTLKDNATITPDGPVVGGNKIKIGLPVELEGFNYRLSGSVSDVRVLK